MRYITRLFVLLVVGLAAHLAPADSLYTFSSVSSTFTDSPLTLGFAFTVNSTVKVSDLGWFDATGAGFQSSHTVGIFDASGNLLTSTTLAMGGGDPLGNSFRYQAVAPITLQAGLSYTLAGTTGGSLDAWTQNDFASDFTVNASFTIAPNAALFTYTSAFVDPDSHYSDYRAYIGPNLEGESVSSDTPEPSAVFLLVIGALVLSTARGVQRRVGDPK